MSRYSAGTLFRSAAPQAPVVPSRITGGPGHSGARKTCGGVYVRSTDHFHLHCFPALILVDQFQLCCDVVPGLTSVCVRPLLPRWWPCYDMFRRLTMTCVVLIFERAASITLFELGLALMSVVFERETSPFQNLFLDKYSCESLYRIVESECWNSFVCWNQMSFCGRSSGQSLRCSSLT